MMTIMIWNRVKIRLDVFPTDRNKDERELDSGGGGGDDDVDDGDGGYCFM